MAVGLAMTATAAYATPITYSVSRTMAGGSSVTGSIVTDGTIGVLAGANVIGWTSPAQRWLNDVHAPGAVDWQQFQPSRHVHQLHGVAERVFFFNFSLTGFALFQNPFIGSGLNAWCMEGPVSNCGGVGIGETVLTTGSVRFAGQTGLLQVASVQTAAVPEPASVVLSVSAWLHLPAAALLGSTKSILFFVVFDPTAVPHQRTAVDLYGRVTGPAFAQPDSRTISLTLHRKTLRENSAGPRGRP
jgi:hypothetical protein